MEKITLTTKKRRSGKPSWPAAVFAALACAAAAILGAVWQQPSAVALSVSSDEVSAYNEKQAYAASAESSSALSAYDPEEFALMPISHAGYSSAEALPTPEPTRDPALHIGEMDNYVSSVQNRLMDLGYLDMDEPTCYYGSSTANAVQLFQRQNGLTADGLAGQDTLSLLFSDNVEKYVMKPDTQGLDVENLQKQLELLGYYSQKVDGYYGENTKLAVMAFQARNGLETDGIAGEKTIEKLFSPEAIPAAHGLKEQVRKANIQTMINTAYAQLGKKYVLGAVGPKSYDCSGLVYYCLKMAGSSRGRYDAAGYSRVSDWKKIKNIDNVQVGDLLFFYNNKYTKVGHVGIYVGGGMMIDASASNGKVVLRSCWTYYWRKHFACARRPW